MDQSCRACERAEKTPCGFDPGRGHNSCQQFFGICMVNGNVALPLHVKAPLERHLQHVKKLHDQDLAERFGHVYLPYALERKYPNANHEWAWQYVFPAASRSIDPRTAIQRRHHVSRLGVATRRESGYTESKDRQGCVLSYLSALVCHAFARDRLRYSGCSGITRS
jgi:hypothetical protein